MKMKLLILAVLPFLTSINMNSQEEKTHGYNMSTH